MGQTQGKQGKKKDEEKKVEKKKWVPPVATRVGKKMKRGKGVSGATKLPQGVYFLLYLEHCSLASDQV